MMMLDYEVLKFIWWALVGILLIGFSVTGGMDMGACNLLPFIGKNDKERRVIINVLGPHWDGNQVWFITAGGALFAAWPMVYAAAFSGFYMAMLLVLFALFLRPVGFDYRSKLENDKWRNVCDWGLFIGGTVPSIIFGVAFGNLLQGVPFYLDEFLRSHYDRALFSALLPLLNPFALLCGVISFAMFTMHGAMWLQLRTEDPIAARAHVAVRIFGLITLVGFSLAGVWIAYGIEGYRIISQSDIAGAPNPLGKEVEVALGAWLDIYFKVPAAMLAPLIGILGVGFAILFSMMGKPGRGYISSGLGMAGIIATAGVSMFPFVMPSSSVPNSSLTMWDATSSHLTLMMMFWAVVIFLPFVLLYTFWCYKRMWGKVTVSDIENKLHSAY
jgi:cytochrome d ubiquinol oxidase subunit II